MIIYLPAPVFLASSEQLGGSSEKLRLDGPPLSFRPRATIPEDQSRKFGPYGPAALPLFCLAPHGVFPASRITPRAVSSYLAFSPLPALFSKNRRCLFCDTFRHCKPRKLSALQRPRVLRGMLPYGVRTFLQRIFRFTSDHLPSATNLPHWPKKKTAGKADGNGLSKVQRLFGISVSSA